MITLTEEQIANIRLHCENVQITDNMIKKLKRELFINGTDVVDDFLGFELNDKDAMDAAMDNVIDQMPPEEFMVFYCNYVKDEITRQYLYETHKFYFTFGSDPIYPYKDGWLIIEAPTEQIARQIFAALYPNTENDTLLRCAFVYTEDRWKDTVMYKQNNNRGASCHTIFKLTNTFTM